VIVIAAIYASALLWPVAIMHVPVTHKNAAGARERLRKETSHHDRNPARGSHRRAG